jgi:hypothetical protein
MPVEVDDSEVQRMLDRAILLAQTSLDTFIEENFEILQSMVQENNLRIFNSQGASIEGDWQGNTLVNTGALRDSLASTQIVVDPDGTIRWASDLDYAVHVDAKYTIYGTDEETLTLISELWALWLESKVEEL